MTNSSSAVVVLGVECVTEHGGSTFRALAAHGEILAWHDERGWKIAVYTPERELAAFAMGDTLAAAEDAIVARARVLVDARRAVHAFVLRASPAANGAPLPEVATAGDLDDLDDLEDLRDERLARGGRACRCPIVARAQCPDCDGTGVVPACCCPECAQPLERGSWGLCDACVERATAAA